MPYVDTKKRAAAQKRYREKKKIENGKSSKRWLFVFYPESVPENWKEIISELQCECVISPLHDRDKNPDGEKKKPHWHGLIFFENAKYLNEVKEILNALNCPMPIIPSGSTRSCVRYMLHADNPEKAQYSKDELVMFGGITYDDVLSGEEETINIISEMMDWVDETECRTFSKLVRYARRNNLSWFRALCRNSTYIMKEYIKSNEYERNL